MPTSATEGIPDQRYPSGSNLLGGAKALQLLPGKWATVAYQEGRSESVVVTWYLASMVHLHYVDHCAALPSLSQ